MARAPHSRRSRLAALAGGALLLVALALLVVGPASGGRGGAALVQGARVEPALASAVDAPSAPVAPAAASSPTAAKPAADPQHHAAAAEPAVWVAFPVKELPHDPAAFTQGLLFERWCGEGGGGVEHEVDDEKAPQQPRPPAPPSSSCRDVFWESTGMNGESTVRAVDVGTGRVLASAALPAEDFGEGLALVQPSSPPSGPPRLLQLTWQSGKAYWHDAAALRRAAGGEGGSGAVAAAPGGTGRTETKTPLGDGWGVTTAPPATPGAPPPLILSDGSSTLTWVDSGSPRLPALRSVAVKDGAKAVASLNELEWVAGPVDVRPGPPPGRDGAPPIVVAAAPGAKLPPPPLGGILPRGEVWANVWGTDCVARVDPASGAVVGWILAPSLRPRAAAAAPSGRPIDVLNGIAADPATGRVWLGGKWWPTVFQVAFADAGAPGGPFGGDGPAALAAARQVCGRGLTV